MSVSLKGQEMPIYKGNEMDDDNLTIQTGDKVRKLNDHNILKSLNKCMVK